jgi:hypothetical protein
LDYARSAVQARTALEANSSLHLDGGATGLEIGLIKFTPQQGLKLGYLDAANVCAMALPQLAHTRQLRSSGYDLIDGGAEDGLNDRRKTAQPIAGALVDAVVLQALGQFGRDRQLGIVLQVFVKDIKSRYRAKPVAKLLIW